MSEKIKKFIYMSILIILLILNFGKNILNTNTDAIIPMFDGFQSDSEYLVFSKILQDKLLISNSKYGLGITVNSQGERIENIYNIIKNNNNNQDDINIIDYTSQFGLQGHVFSFMYNKLNVPFWGIKLVCCLILSIVIVLICYYISIKYNRLMGVIFYITFLLSPWIVAFARNLYWVEFTWLLPVLFGIMLSINYKNKRVFVPAIFVAIFIKCLCGYEYISTIMLATIAFFIVDLFTTKDKNKKEILKTTIIVGLTCIIAFGCALLVHASIRGNGNIIEGVKDVYKNDVLRRTLIVTDKDKYTGAYKESMDASIMETVLKYFKWDSDIILGIEGRYFNAILISVVLILIYNIAKREKNSYEDSISFITFLLATLSWFILAKSHSYIHTHINYVLWYFGFIQICLYIIIKFICKKIYLIGNTLKNGDEKI